MIDHLLQPLVCERFLTDVGYREGHLRVVNALPERRVMGLHSPEIKQVAKQLTREGGEVVMPDGTRRMCANGTEVIRAFEAVPSESLCYEETVIWGYLINLEKCSLAERLAMLGRYVPVLDNWAVCDSYCAHAKWMARADKETLWALLQPWFDSGREFEVRFAVVVAMCYFLNEEWLDKVFERINRLDFGCIKSKYKTVKGKPKVAQQGTVQGAEPYYVRMGVAWLLATALAKFPDKTRAFVRSSNLPADVIKLYIRKSRESFRTCTIKAVELEAYADRKNKELAIEYSATPSGLRRCFMLRLDIEKDTLQDILSDLPRDLRKSQCADAIKAHIATEQIELGMKFVPIDVVDTDGDKFAWSEHRNKNILLIYGGLGCMGRSGRRELAALREEYAEDNLAIVVYYSVSSLEELKEFRNQYSDDYIFISELMPDYSPFKIKYGVQSTPTCFVIDKSGTVVLKTVGFDVEQVKEQIDK